MSEPLYKTSNLQETKRLLSAGVQPLHVELIDNKFLLFTFPAPAAPARKDFAEAAGQ